MPRTMLRCCPGADGCGRRARIFDVEATGHASLADASGPCGAPQSIAELVDAIERDGHGVVMTMGKGGVGKTTDRRGDRDGAGGRGHEVHLDDDGSGRARRRRRRRGRCRLARERASTRPPKPRRTNEVSRRPRADLDARGRALLEEDLRSPCTEEIAVFRAFAQMVATASDEFVVLDTAPTGHTLLLLDAAEAYHREVSADAWGRAGRRPPLLPRLRDPRFTE